MRKHYLDNLRWVTVVLVVIYHVIFMYNGQGIPGTLGKITELEVQYYDVYQYIVYPWFMMLLFIVSGASARYYLDSHTAKEFIKSRTTKLLVPSTIGLFVFQFIQGYINASLSNAQDIPGPAPVKYLIYCISGQGVLWYIQMLWIFSLVLVLIKKIDKDRLWKISAKTPFWMLILMGAVIYGAGQILNTPIICCYRFGLYFASFLIGYFVFSHDEVIERVKRSFPLFLIAAIGLGIPFCMIYFGQIYADNPVYRTPLFLLYGWFGCLAMIGGFARYLNFTTPFTRWMGKRSYGLYIFHYLGISAVALFLARPGLIPDWASYLLSLASGFAAGYILNFVISRIPFMRWAVLGISKKRDNSIQAKREGGEA